MTEISHMGYQWSFFPHRDDVSWPCPTFRFSKPESPRINDCAGALEVHPGFHHHPVSRFFLAARNMGLTSRTETPRHPRDFCIQAMEPSQSTPPPSLQLPGAPVFLLQLPLGRPLGVHLLLKLPLPRPTKALQGRRSGPASCPPPGVIAPANTATTSEEADC